VPAEQTRALDGLRRGDEPLFGGKSAALGELIANEIPVPPGFALSSAAFEAFLEEAELAERIGKRLAGLDPEDLDAVRAVSTEIVDLVRAVPLPEELRGELDRRYDELAGDADEPPVAVRSSALGEDSAEAAFAGQQDTKLWVRGAKQVRAAVHDCWASLYSPEALVYRERMGSGETPAMGVAVQTMVDAAVSGVTFTCNPVNGDPSTVAVNASWGLGLAVVGGEVTPDEYRVSKVTGEVLHRSLGPKKVEYLPDPSGDGAVRVEVPADRRDAPCLDEEQLEAVVAIGCRVEKHFGGPQDIEWALPRDPRHPSELFVLQSRPVTTSRRDSPGRRSAMDLVMSKFGADAAKP
jgi:pyruvate, water dikinase